MPHHTLSDRERTFDSGQTDMGQQKMFTDTIRQVIRQEFYYQGGIDMKIYFTLTGTDYYHGKGYLKNGMRIKLIKEPDNPYDSEAIRVEMAPLSKIGYGANNTKTVIGDSWSAGRMYDHIGKKADAVVKLVTERGVLCKVCKKSLR